MCISAPVDSSVSFPSFWEGVHFSCTEYTYNETGEPVERDPLLQRIANFAESLVSGDTAFRVESAFLNRSPSRIVPLAGGGKDKSLLSQTERIVLLCTLLLPILALFYKTLYRFFHMPKEEILPPKKAMQPLSNLNQKETLQMSVEEALQRSTEEQGEIKKQLHSMGTPSFGLINAPSQLPDDLLKLTLEQLNHVVLGEEREQPDIKTRMHAVGRLRELPLEAWPFLSDSQIANFPATFFRTDPEKMEKLLFLLGQTYWSLYEHHFSLTLEFAKENEFTTINTKPILELLNTGNFCTILFSNQSLGDCLRDLGYTLENGHRHNPLRLKMPPTPPAIRQAAMHFLFNHQLVQRAPDFCRDQLQWVRSKLLSNHAMFASAGQDVGQLERMVDKALKESLIPEAYALLSDPVEGV